MKSNYFFVKEATNRAHAGRLFVARPNDAGRGNT